MNVKEKETRTRRKTKRLQEQGNTRRTVRGCFQKNLKEMEEVGAKMKSHHYHQTYDGDKALTKPALSKHVEVAPDSRNDTTLAHARRTQGLGGN